MTLMPNNSTKLALETSLKNLLLKKPVDKITITDLTNDCGITRMAFYYHLKISTISLNGPATRTPQEPYRERKRMKPGRRD